MSGTAPPVRTGGDDDVPAVRRRRRRRGGAWLPAALAVAGAAALVAAVVLDDHPEAPSVTPATRRASTPVLSARRVPRWTTQPLAVRRMDEALAPMMAGAPEGTCVEVGDGASPWFAHNTSAALAPASNMKLLTSAAALNILGPDSTLTTRFLGDGAPQDGIVAGNLYMVGGGDPLLTTDAYQLREGHERLPETDLEKVADALVAAGVRQVTGSIVGDAGRYDAQTTIPTWPDRHRDNGTIAPLSALMVNDAWTIDPTSGAGEGGPAPDPAQHAAAVLDELLVQRGVTVAGPPVSGTAPASATELLSVESLPVKGLVQEVLRYSDNTTAEMLVKEIGKVRSDEGSTAAGTAAVLSWAAGAGLPVDGAVMLDGSGLSYEDRVTCDLLAAVLRRGGPEGVLATSLPVPGQPGTLEDRFAQGEWPTRLRAKTGTLNTVTALSGWLLTRPGATLDFEMVLNTGDRRVSGEDLAFQQRVLEALLDHPLAPPLAEAGPTPPVPAR